MKLLFVLYHAELTGVSTFNYTLIKAIKKFNKHIIIDVFFPYEFSYEFVFIEKLKQYCDNIYIGENLSNFEYDQIFYNYSNDFRGFDVFKIKGRKKFFCHGLMDSYYIPSKGQFDKIFCLSERQLESFKGLSCEKELIRNFIDLERFSYKKSEEKNLQKVLLFDTRNNFTRNLILSSAQEINCFVQVLGENQFYSVKTIWDIENHILKSNMVVAYGRSAIESMAIGRPVIIYGINGGDGYVNEDNFCKMMETNFSGWSLKTLPNPASCKRNLMIEEFKKFDFKDGLILRKLVEKYFDVKNYVDKILK